jgi:hypothetical protein
MDHPDVQFRETEFFFTLWLRPSLEPAYSTPEFFQESSPRLPDSAREQWGRPLDAEATDPSFPVAGL